MIDRSLEHRRERNQDAPLDLVRDSETWKPVIGLINNWAEAKLGDGSGYSSEELDLFSRRQGVRFPPPLREWWRLAGQHPFVKPGLLPDNSRFIGPEDPYLFDRDFLIIALDDDQTWSGNGIHVDFLSEVDPEVHGINGTITPEEAPALNWYKSKFIATGLRIPALIFSTILSHLFEPSTLVSKGVVHLDIKRDGLLGGHPDDRLVSALGLSRFQNPTIVGDIYSDGQNFIYWWWRGIVCRSAEAAERVCRLVPARPRSQ